METNQAYDVVIIGGGPAGATTAAILAQHGRKVLVIEKDYFPRYHVGESLMPYCWFTLNRLGLIEKLNESAFPKKHSVQFVTTQGKLSQPFYFSEHWDHPAATTWQVVRSDFDKMLLDRAIELGAEVRYGNKSKEICRDENDKVIGVKIENELGEIQFIKATFTVDASGRDALSASRNHWRIKDPELGKISIYTYYKGAYRDPGLDEAATTIAYLPEKGWFWYIPLPDDIVGVGVVAEKDYLFSDTRDKKEILEREAAKNPWIKNRIDQGEQFGPIWATGDFSYRSKYCADDGLVLVGDAFAFLDPVFSSGVYLAIKSGELAADTIHEAINKNNLSSEIFTQYGNELCKTIETMRALVYAFYQKDFSMKDVVTKFPHIKNDLVDCLLGDLSRDYTKLLTAVGEFANLPEHLHHGKPKITRE
jgi:flavin-dependent dehydrogenase